MSVPFTQAINRLNQDKFNEYFDQRKAGPSWYSEAPQWRDNPQVTYETMLRSMGLSNSQEAAMRNAFNSIWNRWGQTEAEGFEDWEAYPDTGMPDFWDFLGSFNWNQELARLSPGARYQHPQRFQRPARWVAF
jgi:hypothetical protein